MRRRGYGADMPFVPVIIVVIVAIIVVALLVTVPRRIARSREGVQETTKGSRAQMLAYRVPTGQDVAALLGQLETEGYSAVTETDRQGRKVVLVAVDGGKDRHRERVRAVIGAAPVDVEGDGKVEGPIHFADEA